MNGKLTENRSKHERREDAIQGSLRGELFERLRARDEQEAHGSQHARDGSLRVAVLDAVVIEHAETVRVDETVQRQYAVHLQRSDECAATLTQDVQY